MSEDDAVISPQKALGEMVDALGFKGKKVFALNLDLDVHRHPVITIQMHATKGQVKVLKTTLAKLIAWNNKNDVDEPLIVEKVDDHGGKDQGDVQAPRGV